MQKDATRQDHASSGALSSGAAWMKGKIIPISEAAIPVHDWGLTHSDITYDVAPVKDGAFFRLDDYLERFFASMDALHLDPKMTKQEIKDALAAMVAASGLRASYVAMVCSRGVPRVPGSRDPRDCENHFYAWCVPYVHVIKPDVLAKGASALSPMMSAGSMTQASTRLSKTTIGVISLKAFLKPKTKVMKR